MLIVQFKRLVDTFVNRALIFILTHSSEEEQESWWKCVNHTFRQLETIRETNTSFLFTDRRWRKREKVFLPNRSRLDHLSVFLFLYANWSSYPVISIKLCRMRNDWREEEKICGTEFSLVNNEISDERERWAQLWSFISLLTQFNASQFDGNQ